jgi:hypothetical protein
MFNAGILRLKTFEHAAAQGVPVSQLTAGRSRRAWQAYRAVAKEIEQDANA